MFTNLDRLFRLKESPQERGRKRYLPFKTHAVGSLSLKESPQERGRKHCTLTINVNPFFCIERKSPRKGTKTSGRRLATGGLFNQLKESPQERGRKQKYAAIDTTMSTIERKSPRKGTKTYVIASVIKSSVHWKKVPKKGDENNHHCGGYVPRLCNWKKVPKKGDENTLKTWDAPRPW